MGRAWIFEDGLIDEVVDAQCVAAKSTDMVVASAAGGNLIGPAKPRSARFTVQLQQLLRCIRESSTVCNMLIVTRSVIAGTYMCTQYVHW